MEKQQYNEELKTINYIAQQNGYNKAEINKVHSKVKNSLNQKDAQQNTSEIKHYLSVEYNDKIGNVCQNVLRKYNCTVAFKTNNTIGSKITERKKEDDPYRGSGVYRLRCDDCDSLYIGQTGREFKTRYKEHMRALTHPDRESKFADHLIEFDHSYTGMEENMTILKSCKKGKRLNRQKKL